MPQYGPIPANIAVIGDFPDRGWDSFSPAAAQLSKLGIVSTSCYWATATETLPPLVKGQPDIDAWISERKTCPGPGWVPRKGRWFHPTLAEGFQRLEARLLEVRPSLVILLGKAPLAWFCGVSKLASWRGSRLSPPDYPFTILPTFHPRSLRNQPENTWIFNLDLTRAYNIFTQKQIPRNYSFIIQPTFEQVSETLGNLYALANTYFNEGKILKLSGDLETRAGHIACFGIAWSPEHAICIPHLVVNSDNHFYWPVDEETHIVWLYGQLFQHPAILWVGQNYLYDCQYFYRHWGILPRNVRDTMVGHHSLHSNIRKGLDFLSSIYARDHVYWKDEIKEWDPKIGEQQYWTYNCLALDTPVLMADSSYKALADIVIGDRIFTFEENPSGHRYARVGKIATVTKTAQSLKAVSRYTFSDGTYLDATPDHKIMTTRGADSRSAWQWREFQDLTLGDKVASFGKPWKHDNTFDGGWLSGIFDGEGTVGFSGLARPYLISVTPLGVVPVGDISTTEGTFIAGGVFVHNCKDACITWEIDEVIVETAKERQ